MRSAGAGLQVARRRALPRALWAALALGGWAWPGALLAAPAQPAPAAAEQASVRRLSVAASAEQGALVLELAPDGLWFNVCPQPGCAARAGRALALPPEAQAGLAGAVLEEVEFTPGRRVAHARIPTGDAAWEALLAAPLSGRDALLLFSGITGPVHGEEGARDGELLWIREGDNKGRRILLGRVREDIELCGRPTLVEPRLLDKDLVLRPAKVQQLSVEERRNARVLDARRSASGPSRGANALRALAASSALGDPAALTDGRSDTAWSEARGGDGRGEFVTFRPLSGVSLVALEFQVRPEGAAAPADGAAPRSFWLASRTALFRVDLAEDAWRSPGAWYRVELPEPLGADCLALVLESSYASQPEARVTLAEVRGVSELQGLDPGQLVARLSTPGDVGAEAVPALLQAGRAGVEAVVGAFGALDALGRERALDVLEAGGCDVVGRVYVSLLADDDERTRRRAEQRLRGCGESMWGELREAFDASSGEAGVRLGRALAELSPTLALELLGPRLVASGRELRPRYREVLSRAAQHPEAEAALRKLLAENTLGANADSELLRATLAQLPRVQPQASASLARAVAAARTFEQRYLLLGPAAALAAQDPQARAFLQRALIDPDLYLRLAAVRGLPALRELEPGLLAATRDPEVRVREASVLRLGELQLASSAALLLERLNKDAWPLVRTSAAQALAGVGPAPALDAALAEVLEDPSDAVRAAVLRTLGRRGASAFLPAIRRRFADVQEAAQVRAAAAQALAELCDRSSLEGLTQAAQRLVGARPSTDDALVGGAATAALGRIHPADLPQRLAPLAAQSHQPALAQLVLAALQTPVRCPLAAH